MCILGAIMSVIFVVYESLEISAGYVLGILAYLAIACLYSYIRMRTHNVTIETSYEEA